MLRTFSFLLALAALPARAADITFLVDTGTEMPMARFQGWQLVGGIQYDLGLALAKAMGRDAKFEILPRQRMLNALEKGTADVICNYMPQWLSGPFGWSQPFLPTVEVLLTSIEAERPRKLSDVTGQPIGTVLGYKYPELEKALGDGFIRDNGPTTDASLRKLAVGRMRHVVTSEYIYHYRLKQGDMPMAVHEPLVIKRHVTQCAVSPNGRVKVAEVNAGIAQMQRSGAVAEIVARYR
ncbi:transporter substrate-binding domain-containing protein [Massilia sp. RP-1-19]|uniref:Transporter substrate-binding domain-containing protein n=1 Tax=Massilia polaris TaxID=2728846 RepID=A0A848HR14_9BURK|nr:transporter substrate-binding domain-containing protein [Massilia polaris]NML62191.1 transporter substrate-binding domain-containing protein [Massilia polaris]